jgi:predicted permease
MTRHELAAVDRWRRRRERIAQIGAAISQDLRYALRSLGRAPAFTLTAIITLVAGLGTTITIFAVIDAVLLKPIPFPHAERLVGTWHDMPPISLYHTVQSTGTFYTYRTQARTIDGIGVYNESEVNLGDERSSVPPQRVTSAGFSASLFVVLGVPAQRGRVFNEDEDRAGAQPVVVISDALWRTHFGADPSVIGRSLEVNGTRREIVGVMPPSFRFPNAATNVWLPLQLDPANPPPTAFAYNGVARLKANVTIADAQRDFAAVLPRVIEVSPKFVPGITTRQIMEQTKPRPVLSPLGDDITGSIAGTLWLVGGAVVLLFLVACANVATLTIVRFDARERELAVRVALGAGASRVATYEFAESLVLAVGAALIGLACAWLAVHALLTYGPSDVPRLAEIAIDWRVVWFAASITVLAAIACTTIPALRIYAGGVVLREGARGGTSGRRQQQLRNALVTGQIALGILMLSASGLLLRSFQALHAVRPGFVADHVATFWVSLPRPRYARNADVMRFYATLLERVRGVPGVRSAGVTSRVPLVNRGVNPNPLYPESAPEWNTKLPPLQIFTSIGGEYLESLGIPLLAGRYFFPNDRQAENEALISLETARVFWHDSTGAVALGKRFRALPTDPWTTVVGVVGNTRDTSLAAPSSPAVYFPELVQADSVKQHVARTAAIVIRTAGDPASILASSERVMRELDPSLPAFDSRPMTDVMRASTARLAFTTLILGAAALITVVLGAVGLYGVLAYLVTLRRRELGIRMALGASPRAIASATTRHGLMLAILGAGAGLVLLALAGRSMRSFLYGVAPWDPFTLAGATALLLLIAAVASWLPARRAARIDPAEALRAE